MSSLVGQSVSRVEGPLKVTGGAQYSADLALPGLVHAVLVDSTIARGRIRQLDTESAEHAPGVLAVMTHLNAPELFYPPDAPHGGASSLRPAAVRGFESPSIYFAGQHVAIVVADTWERATFAARLVRVAYDEQPPRTVLTAHLDQAYRPDLINGNRQPDTTSGDVERGLFEAAVQIDETYFTPIENHHPMELSSCTAVWEGASDLRTLTVYDTTQAVYDQRSALATTFRLPPERVRVVCGLLGGGFGGKLAVRSHTVLAAMAADRVGRPVKLVLTRGQMFTSIGHRPAGVQRVRVGATSDGRFTAIVHDAVLGTSSHQEWVEQSAAITRMMYACPNRRTSHRTVRLNLDTPTIMRGPGEAPGSFAVESAVDELACKLGIDPIELRVRNYAQTDPETGKPWSSNSLLQCYRLGAERFGWELRNPRPRSVRAGRDLVGFGMAAATRGVVLSPATARVRLFADGTAEVATASHDIGTGTLTILAQIVSDVLGLRVDQVRVALGDTDLPRSPAAGGSTTAPSVGSAAHLAALEVRRQLDAQSDGRRCWPIEAEGRYQPPARDANPWSMSGFGAQFCEVRVDADLGTVRVERMLGVFSAGRVLNARTARSQLIGGMIQGLGMALLEETRLDARAGRIVNASLADYLVPVHADIRSVEALLVDEIDPYVNPIGAKGLGELPIVGVAAALANAVYNATGVRIRELPITAEKLLA